MNFWDANVLNKMVTKNLWTFGQKGLRTQKQQKLQQSVMVGFPIENIMTSFVFFDMSVTNT